MTERLEKFPQPLGRGAFGTTYRARVVDGRLRDAWRRDTVAIKIPHTKEHEAAMIEEFVAGRFVRDNLTELDAAANVVSYLGHELFEDWHVLVMEYCDGGSLAERIAPGGRRQPLPVDETLRVACGILAGVGAIHGVRVLHRDVKPDNVLFHGGVPKVGDLGIASILRKTSKTYSGRGTRSYEAPESLARRGASWPADIWSVGVTLFEMLTGELPFAHVDSDPVGSRAVPADPPSARVKGIPAHVDTVVLTALSLDPAARYQTADEMRSALLERRTLDQRLAAIRELLPLADRAREAEAALRRLAHEYPDAAAVPSALGELFRRWGRPDDAVDALEHALRLEPAGAQLNWEAALSYDQAQRPHDALRHLDRALEHGLGADLERVARVLRRKIERDVMTQPRG